MARSVRLVSEGFHPSAATTACSRSACLAKAAWAAWASFHLSAAGWNPGKMRDSAATLPYPGYCSVGGLWSDRGWSSYDVLDTSIDSLNGEAAGLEISDSPGTPPEYGLLSSVKPVRLPTSWESRGEGSPTTAHGPPAWEEEGPPQDLYM
jgi:hypothetical protein